jgi:hypothetical protein
MTVHYLPSAEQRRDARAYEAIAEPRIDLTERLAESWQEEQPSTDSALAAAWFSGVFVGFVLCAASMVVIVRVLGL